MGNPFADGCRVSAAGPGRYRAAIGDEWVLRPLPQGGFVTALALRAMERELDDPGQTLRIETSYTLSIAQFTANALNSLTFGPPTISALFLPIPT